MSSTRTFDVPDRLTVIFDGNCGFCTRSIRYLDKLDRNRRITSMPCQVAKRDPAFRLGDINCGESAWGIAPDDQAEAGGQAAALVAAVLLQRRWPITLGRRRGVRHALAVGYRWVARNRHRFPGDTPFCTAHPGACDEQAATP